MGQSNMVNLILILACTYVYVCMCVCVCVCVYVYSIEQVTFLFISPWGKSHDITSEST